MSADPREKTKAACRRVFDAISDGSLDSNEAGHAALFVAASIATESGLSRNAFLAAARIAYKEWRHFVNPVVEAEPSVLERVRRFFRGVPR